MSSNSRFYTLIYSDFSAYYSATQSDSLSPQNIEPYGYNSHSSTGAEKFELASSQYQDIKKHVAAGGVPILTSLDDKQRINVRRQIISLYPEILSKHEAESVKL